MKTDKEKTENVITVRWKPMILEVRNKPDEKWFYSTNEESKD